MEPLSAPSVGLSQLLMGGARVSLREDRNTSSGSFRRRNGWVRLSEERLPEGKAGSHILPFFHSPVGGSVRATKSVSLLSLALLSALALSACSSTEGSAGGGGKLTYEDSPLGKYTSALWGGMDQEKADKEAAEIQDLVVACMKKEGFEYIPDTQNGAMVDFDFEERETEKWVAANGYGMSMDSGTGEEYVDPNQDYLESLSAGEQTAYYEVLYGPGPTAEEMEAMEAGEDTYTYDWKTAGCNGAAQHEVQGEQGQAYDDPKYAGLFEKMNSLYTKAAEDPAVKKLDAEWSDCMADAGYTEFKTKSEAVQSISDAQMALYDEAGVDADGNSVEIDKAAQDELKQKEIDVALADFKCAEKSDYMQQTLKVQFKLEEQFVADNKSELDAMLAEYAKGK